MKRRAAVGHACQRCRQRRAKCDGKLPCNKCKLAAEQCEYKESKFASKDQLRAEIQELRRARDANEQLPSGSEPTDGSSTNVDGEDSPFSNRAQSSTIASSVNRDPVSRTSQTFNELLSWKSCRPQSAPTPAPELIEPPVLAPLPSGLWNANSIIDSWTSTGWSGAYIRSLFDVTATWDYLPFCCLEKPTFLEHYDANSSRLCSISLVHAILALSMLILNGNEDDTHGPESVIGSRRLLLVAKDLTSQKDGQQLTLPDIQALGFMSLYELRCGRESEADILTEKMLTQVSALHDQLSSTQVDHEDDYTKSLLTTNHGAISLIRMLSLTTGKYFNLPTDAIGENSKMINLYFPGKAVWQSGNILTSNATLPPKSLDAQSVMQNLFQLIEWVYSLNLSNQTSLADAIDAVGAFYMRSLDWYQELFAVLKQDSSRTPLVVFTHIYYHFTLLCAFRPLITQRLTPSMELEIVDVCSQAAQSVMSLVQSYDDLFTLQRVPTLMPYVVLATAYFGLAMEESDCRIPSTHQHVTSEQLPAMTQIKSGQQEFRVNPDRDKTGLPTTVSFVHHARLKLIKMGTKHPLASVAASNLT